MIKLYLEQSYLLNIGFDTEVTQCKTETNLYKVNLINKFKLLKIKIMIK